MTRRRRRAPQAVGILVVATLSGAALWVAVLRPEPRSPGAAVGAVVPTLASSRPGARDRSVYAGLGAWVDGFDYGPAYQATGRAPPLGPTVADDMAAGGVATLYLQAVRNDGRSPQGIVDRSVVADLLLRAHHRGLRVVAWYLPGWADVDADMANVARMASFSVLGQRFDSIAIDIEAAEGAPDTNVRNAALVELSRRTRQLTGADAVGAIVLPPVLTEVVNPRLWPDFPWPDIRGDFDVWLPMSYWTFRRASSGYKDGYTYNEESTRRLRADLDRPDAPVHAIGGIGDQVTDSDLQSFARSLSDSGAIGGSIYDWNSMTPSSRATLSGLVKGPP